MADHDSTRRALSELTALVHRAAQMAMPLTRATSTPLSVFGDKDRLLDVYRMVAGVCGRVLEQIRLSPTPIAETVLDAASELVQLTRLCTEEYDRICQEDEQKRIHTRRWSEVHDEFEAAQREGRPMRAEWSWERQARWEGPLP